MSNKEIFVVKRSGEKELLDIDKIHRVVVWACEGVEGASPSEVEAQAKLKLFDGIKTSDLHEALVNAAHELVSEETYGYDLVSGRLAMYDIRKKVYGSFDVPHILSIIKKNTADGWYDSELEGMYTEDQWNELNSHINHNLDFDFKIAGVREWINKYLTKNRATKDLKDTPQVVYMLVAAVLMHKYVKQQGLGIVKDYYDVLANALLTLPTPVLAGVRTPTRQFASCTVIECGDSLNSISATADALLQYASRKAGLGIGVYNLRAATQPVRNGDATTTGPIPFTQLLQAAIGSCSQGGIRKGSGTFYHNIWHKDVMSLLVLKNNKGTEETRVRHADHAFNINGYLLKKMLSDGDMYLFSPEEVPDLQEAFFQDQDKFAKLYEKYSKDPKVTKVKVKASEVRDLLITERSATNRVYLHFVDNVNKQGSFKPESAPIRQSNLCLEIELPTKPLQTVDDPEGLISLCTLSAINLGKIKKSSDFSKVCRLAVYALDSLLDYQDYPLKAARNSTDWYRPLGIGVNDLAHFLAKRKLKYGSPECLEVVDEYMEAMAFYLTKASVELAKLYGPCGKVGDTKYSDGLFPMDVRKKDVDSLVEHSPKMDWEGLREELKEFGIRNATLTAFMPSETSSRVHSLTNGVEPIRGLITTKDGTMMVAPEAKKLAKDYQITWDIDAADYLKTMAVCQKWVDQSISSNTTYDPTKSPDGRLSGTKVLKDIVLAYKLGIKTLYYQNTFSPDDGVEYVEEADDCDSCKI